MKKGFQVTFDKKRKPPFILKYFGTKQQITYFDFGNGYDPIIKCVKCGVIHWKDLEDEKI